MITRRNALLGLGLLATSSIFADAAKWEKLPASGRIEDRRQPIYVYFLRGQGGSLTSPGIDYMAGTLRSRHPNKNVQVSAWDWDQYQAVANHIARHQEPDAKRIIVGFSLGGNAVTWIQDAMRSTRFDLVVSMDPSIWTVIKPLRPNVARAVLFKNDNPINLVGLADLTIARGFPEKRLTRIRTLMPHLMVDADPGFQARVFQEIAAVVNK